MLARFWPEMVCRLHNLENMDARVDELQLQVLEMSQLMHLSPLLRVYVLGFLGFRV